MTGTTAYENFSGMPSFFNMRVQGVQGVQRDQRYNYGNLCISYRSSRWQIASRLNADLAASSIEPAMPETMTEAFLKKKKIKK